MYVYDYDGPYVRLGGLGSGTWSSSWYQEILVPVSRFEGTEDPAPHIDLIYKISQVHPAYARAELAARYGPAPYTVTDGIYVDPTGAWTHPVYYVIVSDHVGQERGMLIPLGGDGALEMPWNGLDLADLMHNNPGGDFQTHHPELPADALMELLWDLHAERGGDAGPRYLSISADNIAADLFEDTRPDTGIVSWLSEMNLSRSVHLEAGETLYEGTAAGESIRGYEVGSTLMGRGGNDLIVSSAGASILHGGAGDDVLSAHNGFSTLERTVLIGGNGDDRLRADGPRVDLRGGDGDDVLSGGNRMWGGAGDDMLEIEDDGTVARGGAGNDTLHICGWFADDGDPPNRIFGDEGVDRFIFEIDERSHQRNVLMDITLEELEASLAREAENTHHYSHPTSADGMFVTRLWGVYSLTEPNYRTIELEEFKIVQRGDHTRLHYEDTKIILRDIHIDDVLALI